MVVFKIDSWVSSLALGIARTITFCVLICEEPSPKLKQSNHPQDPTHREAGFLSKGDQQQRFCEHLTRTDGERPFQLN